MKPIAIFYHCLLFMDSPDNLCENALNIVRGQMEELKRCGLLDAAAEFHVGINGGLESLEVSRLVIPPKANMVLHGLQCRNECRTIRMIEEWLPGHDDWYVLYFHAKNSSHATDTGIGVPWRACMMRHCVTNWRKCVAALNEGYDVAGVHFMEPPATPPGQRIMAGNFFWSKASFLAMLPSIMARDRIKESGIDSIDSRFEAEVWIGNGPRSPHVKDFHGPLWNPSRTAECAQ